MKKIILFSLLIALAGTSWSQSDYGTGPGGVGTKTGSTLQPENEIWLTTDTLEAGTDYDDSNMEVLTWPDVSGNNHDAGYEFQPANHTYKLNSKPLLIKNKINGRDVLRFGHDGLTSGLRILDLAANTNQIDTCPGLFLSFVIKRNILTDSGTFGYIVDKREESNPNKSNRAFGMYYDGGAAYGQVQLIMNANNYFYTGKPNGWVKDTTSFFLLTANYNITSGLVFLYINGRREPSLGAGSYNRNVFDSDAPLVLSENCYNDLGEFIMYRKGLNDAQQKIVHNYLAAKFGIAIKKDASGVNQLFSITSGACEEVIGVGRGQDGTKHLASAGGGIILKAVDASLDKSDEYVLIGHTKDGGLTADATTGFWSRNYYAQKTTTNTIDVKLYFDFNKAGLSAPTAITDYALYYTATKGGIMKVLRSSADSLNSNNLMFAITNMATGYYNIGKSIPATPVVSPFTSPIAYGTDTVNVSITSTSILSNIYYTLNGKTPNPDNSDTYLYTDSVKVGMGYTILSTAAMAGSAGKWISSDVVTNVYSNADVSEVYAPEFSPLPGTYSTVQNIVLSSNTPSAKIYYTLNGTTTPDSITGTLYTAAIAVSVSKTIKAIAYANGLNESAVSIGYYVSTVDVKEISSGKAQIAIWPNPTKGLVNIKFNTESAGDVIVRVFDVTGAMLVNNEIEKPAGVITQSFNFSGLKSGLYFVELDQPGVSRDIVRMVIE